MRLIQIHVTAICVLGFALMGCGEKRSGEIKTGAVLPRDQSLGVWNLSAVRCGDAESPVPLLTDSALSSQLAKSHVNVAPGASGYKVWEYMTCRLTTPMNFTQISDAEFVETEGDTTCEPLPGGSCDGIPSCGLPGGGQNTFGYVLSGNTMDVTMPLDIAQAVCGVPNTVLKFTYVR